MMSSAFSAAAGSTTSTGSPTCARRRCRRPFGAPSAPLVSGPLGDGASAASCRATGAGTGFSPSEINYRANVHALKQLGAERVLSVSAVGSLREGLAPGRPRARRPVHRQDLPARVDLLRRRRRRPRRLRRSGLRGARGRVARRRWRRVRGRRAEARAPAARAAARALAPRRHLRVHGGAAVLDARRVAAAPQLGRRRHRHDRRHRGQALPRGRALLRVAGAGRPTTTAGTPRRRRSPSTAVVAVLLANVAARQGDRARRAAARVAAAPACALRAAPPRTPS